MNNRHNIYQSLAGSHSCLFMVIYDCFQAVRALPGKTKNCSAGKVWLTFPVCHTCAVGKS
jgi:hypothetical protein